LWPLLVWFTERIFKEDRLIVEAEQAAHDAQGADWNQEVFPVIQRLRTLLRQRGTGTGVAGNGAVGHGVAGHRVVGGETCQAQGCGLSGQPDHTAMAVGMS
jgi:hypothetical protein